MLQPYRPEPAATPAKQSKFKPALVASSNISAVPTSCTPVAVKRVKVLGPNNRPNLTQTDTIPLIYLSDSSPAASLKRSSSDSLDFSEPSCKRSKENNSSNEPQDAPRPTKADQETQMTSKSTKSQDPQLGSRVAQERSTPAGQVSPNIRAQFAYNYGKVSQNTALISNAFLDPESSADIVTLMRMDAFLRHRIISLQSMNASDGTIAPKTPVSSEPSRSTKLLSTERDNMPAQNSFISTATSIKESARTFDLDKFRKDLSSFLGFASFREDQFQAIYTALQGRDVLVLTPAGIARHFCYHLVAMSKYSVRQGMTIVFSAQDSFDEAAVAALQSRSINVMQRMINPADIRQLKSNTRPEVLFVNPGGIRETDLREVVDQLAREGHIARFVLDNALTVVEDHASDISCGYICSLRARYPDVPIVALAEASADAEVQKIVTGLKLEDYTSFRQSFDRKDLHYAVTYKSSSALENVISFIRGKYPKGTGVVYCLSSNACASLAPRLTESGLSAVCCHGEMEATLREKALSDWKNQRYKILLTTTNSDPTLERDDIRFVIHYDLPMSLSSYYWETDNAGRDGQPADCLLCYNFRENRHLASLSNRSQGKSEAYDVVKYCESESVCRRKQLLHVLGENHEGSCGHCDVCVDTDLVEEDFTMEAQDAIRLVQSLSRKKVSLTYCQAVFGGVNDPAVQAGRGHQNNRFGAGSHMTKDQIEQMFDKLSYLGALNETFVSEGGAYVEPGPSARSVLQPKFRLAMKIRRNVDNGETMKARISSSPDSRNDSGPSGPVFDTQDESQTLVEESIVEMYSTNQDDRKESSLLRRLQNLRRNLAFSRGVNAFNVLSDETLIQLSAVTPQDYMAFQKVLRNTAGITATEEREAYVEERWKKYGPQFLSVCIESQAGNPPLVSDTRSKLKVRLVGQEYTETSKNKLGLQKYKYNTPSR